MLHRCEELGVLQYLRGVYVRVAAVHGGINQRFQLRKAGAHHLIEVNQASIEVVNNFGFSRILGK